MVLKRGGERERERRRDMKVFFSWYGEKKEMK